MEEDADVTTTIDACRPYDLFWDGAEEAAHPPYDYASDVAAPLPKKRVSIVYSVWLIGYVS